MSQQNKLGVLTSVSTGITKEGNETVTFETSGAFQTSGTFFMEINLVSADSIHCVNRFSAPEGTITMQMKCSLVTNTRAWHIINGTERYRNLRGEGSLAWSSQRVKLTEKFQQDKFFWVGDVIVLTLEPPV